MADFVRIGMGSMWGWIYLLVILLVCWTTSRYGIMRAFILMAFGLAAWSYGNPAALIDPAYALAAGPVPALQAYFLNPPWDWSPGAAAFLLGLILGILMLPLASAYMRFAIQLRLVSNYRDQIHAGQGTFQRLLHFSTGGPLESLRGVVRIITMNSVWLMMVVCLWITLGDLSNQGYALGYTWLGLADITLPRLSPVWNLKYFIAPFLLFVIQTAYARDIEESGAYFIPLPRDLAVFLRVVVFVILGCFIPAGISWFLVGYLLATLPSSWVSEAEVMEEIVERESEPEEENWNQHEPEEGLPQRFLLEVPDFRDMVVINHKRIVALDKTGSLHRWNGTQPQKQAALYTQQGLGLMLRDDGGELLVIGEQGTVSVLHTTEDETIRVLAQLDKPICGYAMNPFGSLLAYSAWGYKQILIFNLQSGAIHTAIKTDQQPEKLAFSLDGRELAVGYADGRIEIIDMSKRQIIRSLVVSYRTGAVEAVLPGKDGNWVALYNKRYVACWGREGERIKGRKCDSDVYCAALDVSQDILALGRADGEIEFMSLTMDGRVRKAQASGKPVVCLRFFNDLLFCADRSGTIRSIDCSELTA